MTITANVGLPGSGKSLHSVGEQICGALRERRLVVTNVPLKIRALSEYVGFDVANLVEYLTEDNCNAEPFSDIDHFTRYEKWRSEGERGYGALFVIDECHKCFAEVSGLKANDHPIAKWFAEHRHKGCDVLLMTQDRMAIPSAIRRRVEETYLFRKLGALGLSNRYVKLMYHGEQKEALQRSFGKYKKEWFGLYYSTRAGVSERLFKGKNIFLNPRLIVIVILLLSLAFYLMSHGVHMPGAAAPAKATGKGAEVSAAPAGDGTKLLHNPEHLLTGGADVSAVSPELVDLQNKYAVLQAKYNLEVLERQRPERDPLDGSTATISGYFMVNGQAVYFLDVKAPNGSVQSVKAQDLQQYGFEVTAVNACLAFLRGPRGSYRLTCDGPVRFGFPEDGFRQGRLAEFKTAPSSEVLHTGDSVDLRKPGSEEKSQ